MQIYVNVRGRRAQFGSDISKRFLIRREVLQLLARSSGLRAPEITEQMSGMRSQDFAGQLRVHADVTQALTFFHSSGWIEAVVRSSSSANRWGITEDGRLALADLGRQMAEAAPHQT